MKKTILFLTVLSSAIFSQAYAKNGFYAGANIAHNIAEQKYRDRGHYGIYAPNNSFVRDRGTGFGVNVGYKQEICKKVFLAPEIFYDNLNVDLKDYYYNDPTFPSPNDQLQFKYRYGAKLNVGYKFSEKFAGFVNFGVAQLRYKYDWPSVANANPSNKAEFKRSPIIGVGVSYDITDHVTARFEYNRQNFNTGYGNAPASNGAVARSRTEIESVKLGLVYNF